MSGEKQQQTPAESTQSRHWQRRKSGFARLVSEVLRKRRRKSVVEIDRGSKHYALTSCMQEGLSWVPEAVLDVEKRTLKVEDFSEEIEVHFTNHELDKPYLFKSFAPKVFLCMRRNLDISEDHYQGSLNPTDAAKPEQKVFLKFFSNSKGGQSFFFCNNKRYMIKTEKLSDVRYFLKILPKYFEHLERYPHSLIVRYLGLHYIKIKGERGRFFTVMQSVFHPSERITKRYDLKGCTANRFEDPGDSDDDVIVMKDNNLGSQKVKLGPLHDWFCQQTQIDCAFLNELGVIDYSLLLGEHTLHPSDISQDNSMPELVLRVSKSLKTYTWSKPKKQPNNTSHVSDADSGIPPSYQCSLNDIIPEHNDVRTIIPTSPVRQNGDAHMHDATHEDLDDSIIPGVIETKARSTSSLINQSDSLVVEDISDVISNIADHDPTTQNLRCLQNVDNAWHVIDGPTHRYYVGIIDIFTVYGVRKRFENVLKHIRFPMSSFSTVNPNHYSERLHNFIVEHCE